MTNPPPRRRLPLDDDALLARGLEVFRADAGRAPAEDLAARVLAAARAGDPDQLRFRRLARTYAVAASALLVVGVGGTAMNQREARGEMRAVSKLPPTIDDLEASRLARELEVTIDGQRVGGK